MIKLTAIIIFDNSVAAVANQTSLLLTFDSLSLDIWMPSASDIESATAIVKIPPIIARVDWVPECRPTIRPRVVITPDVMPKLKPVFRALSNSLLLG